MMEPSLAFLAIQDIIHSLHPLLVNCALTRLQIAFHATSHLAFAVVVLQGLVSTPMEPAPRAPVTHTAMVLSHAGRALLEVKLARVATMRTANAINARLDITLCQPQALACNAN